jgi:hypothetical protein
MKYKWIILIIVILAIIGILVFLLTRKEKVEIKDLKTLHYSYSNGYGMYAYAYYDIKCDSKCTITIKPSGFPDESEKTYDMDDNSINSNINILNKYEVSTWDGFDKSDKNVLDGNSFSFSLKTKDGYSVDAKGYMMWPDNYRNVRDELEDIFISFINEGDFNRGE